MKKYFILLVLFSLFCSALNAQVLNLIPYPKQVSVEQGSLKLKKNTWFYNSNPAYKQAISFLNSQLGSTGKNRQAVQITLDRTIGPSGSYRLGTEGKEIRISGSDGAGVFNGIVTLVQLIRSGSTDKQTDSLPVVRITDEPRYEWRGFMLDESRHFFGKQTVKDLLNWMAFYKLNRFHWHLTDAQGWRIEIKKYPLLTKVGGIGNFTDSTAQAKYYTQEDIKEIVAYAKQRHIEVIPEIDMPGHATAANKAYPEYSGGKVPGFDDFTFNPGKEATYQFIADVLKELKPLFPAGKIHIGGDEVFMGIKAWDNNADVQALMVHKGYSDKQQAEAYFLRRVADSVKALNYKVMCWDEAVAANLPAENVIVNWWRQNKPESLSQALNNGYSVILSPRLPMYFDFVQDSTHRSGRKWEGRFNGYLDVYNFPENDLAGEVYTNKNVIGVQANLWTETVVTTKRLQYLLFPRLAALAEAGWTAADAKNDQAFSGRLKRHLKYYEKAKLYYYDPFSPMKHPEAIDVTPKAAVKD